MYKITHVMYQKSKNYKYLTMLSNSDLSFNDGSFLCMYKASESLHFRVLCCMPNITKLMSTCFKLSYYNEYKSCLRYVRYQEARK